MSSFVIVIRKYKAIQPNGKIKSGFHYINCVDGKSAQWCLALSWLHVAVVMTDCKCKR